MVKVLVVDDSAFMRKAISSMLENDPDITVVGTARDGREGVDMVRQLDPDVVTMDIEMPVMDGLSALKRIMMEMPRPVIMISSLTTAGAEATLKALDAGAVDFIPKKLSRVSLEIIKIEDDLRAKVKAVARARILRPTRFRPGAPLPGASRSPAPPSLSRARGTVTVAAIGVSTGGPPAVQTLLAALPADFPACILIAQHMPGAFTGPFAQRLDGLCPLAVSEAVDGAPLKPGHVYVAPGGLHLRVRRAGLRVEIEVGDNPSNALYKPSVDELMGSVADVCGKQAVGVMLTGMGRDGLEGARKLKAAGGRLLAQSEATCVVYGMPKAVVDAGLADKIVDLHEMAAMLRSEVGG